jgi:hypothetical protein
MVEKLTLGDTHLNALQYCAKGELVETNMLTTDINEQGKQMMQVAAGRPGLHQTCMHFSLSGTVADNERLTTSDYQRLMKEHLEQGQGIDLSKHQYSMFVHRENTGRMHIHAVVNRIATDGTDHNMWQYKTKGKASSRALEEKYDLERVTNDRAPEKVKLTSGELRQKERTGQPCAKENIADAIEKRIPEATSLEELRDALVQDDITMEILRNNDGPYGLRFSGRDPDSGQLLTFAGGQIASNCQCRAVIGRIERAQERAVKQRSHAEGKPLTPWERIQTNVKQNIPGCRSLEDLTATLQEQGITVAVINNELSYTVDGKQFRGRLPKNATLQAVNARIESNAKWRTDRDTLRAAVRTASKNADSVQEIQERLAAQGVTLTVTTGADGTRTTSYTLESKTISGRAVPKGCTIEDLEKRLDQQKLYHEINDIIRETSRELGADLDSVLHTLHLRGYEVSTRTNPDGRRSITGYTTHTFSRDADGQVQVQTRAFKDWIPGPLTAEAIQNRCDTSELYRQVTSTAIQQIRVGGNLDAVRAALAKQGITMTVEKDPETGVRNTTYTNDKGVTLTQDQIPVASAENINARVAARQAAARRLAARNILTALAAGGRQEEEEENNTRYSRPGY